MKFWLTVTLTAALALPVSAQQPLDRKKIPTPGKAPTLRVPAWTKAVLSNGAELIVSEKHDLPLVSFSITLLGGGNQFQPKGKEGVASLAAAMLSEGTRTRDGEALSNALQLLGTSITASVGHESGSMSFVSTAPKFGATLDILAEMLVQSTFPADALERLRGQRLVALAQAKAQPGAIASRVFPRVLYGDAHPYGRSVTEESVRAITREDVLAFHEAYWQPGRALITVVGDVTPAVIKPLLERSLSAWRKGGVRPTFSYPRVPDRSETTIFLVDKAGAAQSTFAIGQPGPPRSSPDYFALQLMNTILGGMFQSRLNANIREEKGYSYGVFSNFQYGKGPGPFRAGGDVVSDKTDAALVEFMKELRGILGARPITDDELTTAKDALVQRLPGVFASVSGVNGALTSLWTEGLPADYYQQYAKSIAGVSKEDVTRVARQHLDPERVAIVIVGDRATTEEPLKKTGIAPIVHLDIEGTPVGTSRPRF